MKRSALLLGGIAVVAGIIAFDVLDRAGTFKTFEAVAPDWEAIAAWPGIDATEIEAIPNPKRRITAVVLDDSGSMGSDIEDAKAAVLEALGAMDATDRVAVVALNAGVILPFTEVGDAQEALRGALQGVRSRGSTPLTPTVQTASRMLAQEAAMAQGFGTYRLIVTTDGQADNGLALEEEIAEIARSTPIQLSTIGIGLGGGHVLKRSDIGSFVDVDNVAGLASALQQAVAENTNFDAITGFEEN